MRHATPRPCTISGKRDFPVSELKLFASARSAGKDIKTPFGEESAMHAATHSAWTLPVHRCNDTTTPVPVRQLTILDAHATTRCLHAGAFCTPPPCGCAWVGLLAHGVPATPRCAGDKKIEEFTLESARACDVVFLAVAALS